MKTASFAISLLSLLPFSWAGPVKIPSGNKDKEMQKWVRAAIPATYDIQQDVTYVLENVKPGTTCEELVAGGGHFELQLATWQGSTSRFESSLVDLRIDRKPKDKDPGKLVLMAYASADKRKGDDDIAGKYKAKKWKSTLVGVLVDGKVHSQRVSDCMNKGKAIALEAKTYNSLTRNCKTFAEQLKDQLNLQPIDASVGYEKAGGPSTRRKAKDAATTRGGSSTGVDLGGA